MNEQKFDINQEISENLRLQVIARLTDADPHDKDSRLTGSEITAFLNVIKASAQGDRTVSREMFRLLKSQVLARLQGAHPEDASTRLSASEVSAMQAVLKAVDNGSVEASARESRVLHQTLKINTAALGDIDISLRDLDDDAIKSA